MAIKASDTMTLASVKDVASVTPYYLAQTSTLSPPSKPTTKPPSGWSTTQPALDTSKTCYIVFLNVLSDGTWAYSDVSTMSEYEAAKTAKNTADAAATAAAATNQYFWHRQTATIGVKAGAHITEVPQEAYVQSPSTAGGNALIKSTGLEILNGVTSLADFGSSVRIGQEDKDGNRLSATTKFDPQSMVIEDSLSHEIFEVGDLNDGSGALVNDIFVGDGSTRTFTTNYRIKSAQHLFIDGYLYQSSAVTNRIDRVVDGRMVTSFTLASTVTTPASGAEIKLYYKTDEPYMFALAFGGRYLFDGTGKIGKYSSSFGVGLTAENDWQTSLGKFNDNQSNTLLEVGNGTSDAPSNALVLDRLGNLQTAGDITDGSGNVLRDKADTSAIPTKTSDITNDSGFITSDANGNVSISGEFTSGNHATPIGYKTGRQTGTYSLATGTTFVTVPASNLSRITLSEGTWIIHAHAAFASNNTGRRAMRIYSVTSSEGLTRSFVNQTATNGAATNMNTMAIVSVGSTDITYTIQLAQNSGSANSVDLVLEAVRIA